MKKLGVIIARFQVPELTPGHIHLLNSATAQSHAMLILLGVPAAPGRKRHPLTFQMRADMVRSIIDPTDNAGLWTIAPLPDIPNDDGVWTRQVDTLIQRLFPFHQATIWGSRDSALTTYGSAGGRHTVRYIAPHPEGGEPSASGTDTRASVEPANSRQFRAGVIWASENRFDAVMPCVDMAVFQKDSVLLARKTTDQPGQWRLIGGFVDAKDKSYEAAAAREVREETGLEVGNVRYVGSCGIDDSRYRGGPETVKTAVFAMDYVFGNAKADDDIAEVRWFPIHEAMARIAPFHAEALALAIASRYPAIRWTDGDEFQEPQEIPAA
jgi:bifunctional NMN adenylyltransferase/nudix hydrolase